MHPLETYLAEIATLRGATKETSGYGVLQNLLNAVGHALKPKVKCIIHPKNSGAGIPDGGLFTPDQLKHHDEGEAFGELVPARGVIEVKSVGEDIAAFAESEQVEKYLAHYGQALLTNYREFLLLKRIGGKTHQLESFQLAPDEKAFWLAAAHPRKTTDALGERAAEYLKRVMLHAAPLNNPKDVAFFLASYARDARARVEGAGNLPALAAVRGALEEALGMKFEAEKGEHFFRSTLVQTLFYGVFSAWVLWHKQHSGTGVPPVRFSPDDSDDGSKRTGRMPVPLFDWRSAAWTLHVPMIKALFEQVATPTKLGPLGLVEVLDWTAAALNRVDRAAFFEKFLETHAVQYFYEPFLEAFDPELRKQLGVWYTPPEIVQYQVARVDAALREELDIPDGLADPRVFVLDPCCGTGAYLVEVLRKIEETLKEEKGEGALAELTIKEAAQKRVFGFEIMPAPFVVAHLQMGLLLQNLGVPLDDAKNERAGIFLTNALTGWNFTGENTKLANWPELEAERKGAGEVKQEKPILVILGNPPYNAYAGISPEEEQGLVESYKGVYEVDVIRGKGKAAPKQGAAIKKIRRYRLSDLPAQGGWGIKKYNLDDLYVRFFRIAERRIAEKSGKGIISFISNSSYLGDPSFVIMRERFLKEFDSLWFDCLNGDSRETGKLTPEGKPDPSVFSTEYNREGIRVGTAIGLLVRKLKRSKRPEVFFRQFWGADKRAKILESLEAKKFAKQYESVESAKDNRFAFVPSNVVGDYLQWPRIPDFAATASFNGPVERRAFALISVEKKPLASRMAAYFDESVSDSEVKQIYPSLMMTGNRIVGPEARKKVLNEFSYDESRIVRYPFKPYDIRWCYLENLRPLFSEPSPQLLEQRFKGNHFFITRDTADKDVEGSPFYFSPLVCDYDCISGHARHFPMRLRATQKNTAKKKDDGNGEFGNILHEAAPAYHAGKITANLSPAARAYLAKLGIKNPDDDEEVAGLIWMHALAIGYSPAYLTENADGVRQDWPRIPLPDSKAALLASAELGKKVAALLDTENGVEGVTTGKLKPEFKEIAVLSSTKNLSLTAGWGHAGQGGVTMPGKGKLEKRGYTAEETAAFAARLCRGDQPQQAGSQASPTNVPNRSVEIPAAAAGLRHSRAPSELFGPTTHDIFLNEAACWQNVPEKVWDYTIGGYQVIKKWLSYREFELLGRALTPDEAREVTHMARRIAALILLQPELDQNYQAVKAATTSL